MQLAALKPLWMILQSMFLLMTIVSAAPNCANQGESTSEEINCLKNAMKIMDDKIVKMETDMKNLIEKNEADMKNLMENNDADIRNLIKKNEADISYLVGMLRDERIEDFAQKVGMKYKTGGDINARFTYRSGNVRWDCSTLLMVAAMNEELSVVRALLSHPKIDVNLSCRSQTALHLSARYGKDYAVSELLKSQDIDVNAVDDDGKTALQSAVYWDKMNVVKVLLAEERVNIANKDNKGNAAIHDSFRKPRTGKEMFELFLNCSRADPTIVNGDGKTMLHLALEEGIPELIPTMLADPRFDPETKDNSGQTALHFAAKKGYVGNIRLLLADTRVNPSTKDNKGLTALHVAAMNDAREAVDELLMDDRIDINVQNGYGLTALHLGAKHVMIVEKLLLDGRLDLNIQNADGETALHYAVKAWETVVVKKLLNDDRVDPNIQDIDGNTALHVAAGWLYHTIIEAFYYAKKTRGVDFLIRNEAGETALDITKKRCKNAGSRRDRCDRCLRLLSY